MKWRWMVAGGAVASIFIAGFSLVNSRVEADVFPMERVFSVTYSAVVANLPQEAARVRVWIPLAVSRDGQKVIDRRIEAPGSFQVTKDPVYGNEMLYYEANSGSSGELRFEIDYKVHVSKNKFEPLNGRERLDLYLKPSRFMVVNEEVKKKIREATREDQTLRDKARSIYDYVIRNMVYDKTTPGWGNGDTLRACLVGKGNCTDFHSLFISMAQACEIPARFKIGFTVPKEPEGRIPGYHCWADFYEQEKGWRPIDASDAWKHPERKEAYFGNLDTNKFLLSVGRDITLVPRASGEAVNIFFYPYVEVNQKEHKGFKTDFYFKNKQ